MARTHALGELVKSMTTSFGAARVDQYATARADSRVVDLTTGLPHQGTHFRMSVLEGTPHDGDVAVIKEVEIDPTSIHDKLCVDFSDRSGQHATRIMLPLEADDRDLSFQYRYSSVKGGSSYTSRVDHLSVDSPVHTIGNVIKKLMSESKINAAQATALLTCFAAYHQHQETLQGRNDHRTSERFKAAATEMAAREERDWQQKLQADRDFQTPRGV